MKTSSALHPGYQQQAQVFDNFSWTNTQCKRQRVELDNTHNANDRGFSLTNTQCKRQRLQFDKHTMQTTEASVGQTHNANDRGFSWTNTQCKRQASVGQTQCKQGTYILFPVLYASIMPRIWKFAR